MISQHIYEFEKKSARMCAGCRGGNYGLWKKLHIYTIYSNVYTSWKASVAGMESTSTCLTWIRGTSYILSLFINAESANDHRFRRNYVRSSFV